jgi:hypothetical protein
MSTEHQSDLRQYAWNYFSLHADQRMKTFNFYIVLSGAIVAGIIAALKENDSPAIAALLAFILAFLSFVFWKMEQRVRYLVKHGENALKHLEGEIGAEALQLLNYEEKLTKGLPRIRKTWSPVRAHFTYSTCLNAVFWVIAYGSAFVGCILLLISFLAHS